MDKFFSVKLRILSFMAMIMIIYLHSYNLVVRLAGDTVVLKKNYNSIIQIFISDGITRIAVPLFAAISGFLFFYNFRPSFEAFINKYKKRFTSLFVPYLLWSIGGILFFFLIQMFSFSHKFFNSTYIKDYTLSHFAFVFFIFPINYQLWFLRDLILLVLLTPVIYFVLIRLKLVAIIVLFVLWFIDFNYVILNPDTIFFFSLGSYLAINPDVFFTSSFPRLSIVALIVQVVLLSGKLIFLPVTYITILTVFILKISIISGIFGVWYLYDRLFSGKDLTGSTFYKYSTYSFFLYAFHEPALTLLKKACFFLMGKAEFSSLLLYLILPVIIIAVSLILGSALKKYANGFYNLITGGR